MAEKETKSCSDCIHFDVCYKIEHFGRDLEDTSPCKQFISKDVAPVRHGCWINENFYTHCSACGKMAIYDKYGQEFESDYCPHCGAKMDGGD